MTINDYIAFVEYHQRERAMTIRNERHRVALERAAADRPARAVARRPRHAAARRPLAD